MRAHLVCKGYKMIKVAIAGIGGRMGSAAKDAVQAAPDMELVCGIDLKPSQCETLVYSTLKEAIQNENFEVLVDFTQPSAVAKNVEIALSSGVNCVVGTTGMNQDTLDTLSKSAINDACLFYAPNFTTGAVLMMEFSKAAAKYFPEAEVIEYHHCNKKDAPSGTAVRTAQLIANSRDHESQAPGAETDIAGAEGSRGALVQGVPVHAIRSMGYVASQEVIFGSYGQTLTIRHDSWDRQSYMPGVLLGIREVVGKKGLIVGLEKFMS